MEEEAEEDAKNMDLNKVVLRFQAFQYNKKIEAYQPITHPVDSNVVSNLSMCKIHLCPSTNIFIMLL